MRKVKLFLLMLVALVGGLSASAAKTVYVDPVGGGTWLGDNAKISLYVFGDGDGWATSESLSDGVIKFTFDDKFTSMVIVRGQNNDTWDGMWNQTTDITDIQLNKLYKANGFNDSELAYTVEDYTEPIVAGYTVDFNTAIDIRDHAFQVASNWRHIVDSYEDSWSGNETYPSYSYSETAGVNGSGALSCSTNQNSNNLYDLLVTPVVKGVVTVAAKATASYYTPQLTFYKIVEGDGGSLTRGDQIAVDVSAVNSTDYVTITIPVDEAGERIGIRSSYVWLDNFTATEATIVPEAKMVIASAVPTATTGTIYWDQQANGKVLVSYTVTVTNTGDVDLTQGSEGFSVSIINRSTGVVYGTVAVPQDLAKGETSAEFVVSAEVETSIWPNSYTYINMDLKENLFGSTLQRAQSHYKAYEPKFVFRVAESTSTSSITAAEAWGTITESTTKSFEIANTGTAPLTIKSITLPEGFTSDNAPAAEFTLAKGEAQALNITQDASEMGTFTGTLAIVYLDKDGAEQTYSLAFSATVIGANTWTADFNGDGTKSSITYPAGSIAEAGINSDYSYSSGKYNVYAVGRTQSSYATGNNKFITPKLHANAGDKLAFDVKGAYGTSYYAKVYVSTDRVNWGDPVAYYTYAEAEGSEAIGGNWATKTITFDAEGDYYVAFALYGTFAIDNLVGLEKVNVAHDLYIKSVNWPDASIKSGSAQTKPVVEIIPLTDETADAYTVKFYYGEYVVEIPSKPLTASATSTTSFAASFTPVVEETTSFGGCVVMFEFTDRTWFMTESYDFTVTNEAIFHFLNMNSVPTSKWNEPTDRTAPITFGKTNAADTQSFVIFNWGSAPLTVNSIELPEGFTTDTEFPLTVAAMDESNLSASAQALTITFSAAEAGTYSGNMVITYSDDKTFMLPISGTKLDPEKFYANFGGESNQWPAGSVYQSNVSTTYVNTGDYAITSTSTTDNMFVTPKLTAKAGDKLLFDAKLYSSYWSEGTVNVYAAATREEVLNAEGTRVLLFTASGAEGSENLITTDYQTFEVTVPEAGDYFFGFEISNRPYVDEIYGLKAAAVGYELAIASANIPTEAMQNVAATASVNVQNFGLADVAADAYTMTVFVNGEAVATGETVALPMNHKLSDAGTQIAASFRYAKVGTFPVYVEVKAGDYTIATEPVDVVFAEEEAAGSADMAANGTSGNVPLNLNYKNSESLTLYNAETLAGIGLNNGSKITSITYKGYKTTDAQTTSFQVYYKWTDAQTIEQPTSAYPYAAEDAEMTMLVNEDHTWNMVGSASELDDMIVLDFSETPLVYEAGKSLCIYMHSYVDGYKAAYFEKSTLSNDFCYVRYQDAATMSKNWSKETPAAIHFALAAQPTILYGVVKNSAGEPIEGATITLVSSDGDNVQYEGTTDAEGAYSIKVVQASRTYNATVSAEGYDDTVEEICFTCWSLDVNNPSLSWDFTMLNLNTYTATFTTDYEWAEVYAYVWSGEGENKALGEWPGTKLEAVDGVYTVTIKAEAAPEKIIFNNGDNGEQTPDLDFVDGKAYDYSTPKGPFADGNYYFQNVATQKFLAAGANWGTHAVVNEIGLDFVATFADGKYTLDSQVSNGGDLHFLNDEWTDSSAFGWTFAEVSEGVYTISNGTQFLTAGENDIVTLADDATAEAAQWTLVTAADRIATFEAATAQNGVDATFFIKGANFNRNDLRNAAWSHTRNGGNETFAGPNGDRKTYGCEYWNNTFEVSQTITNLPNGVYEFSIAGFGTNGTTMIFANETEVPFVNTTSASSFDAALEAIAAGEYTGNTTGRVIVENGTLTIGVKRTSQVGADWTVIDNARLTFWGTDVEDLFKAEWEETLAAAQAALEAEENAVVTGDEKEALAQAIADNTTVEDTEEAYKAAIADLNAAVATFTNAKAAYQSLVDAKAAVADLTFQYASAEKKAAAEAAAEVVAANATDAANKVEALYLAYRRYAESSAALEGIENSTFYTSAISNPSADYNMTDWSVVNGEGSNGSLGVLSGEPWTDGENMSEHNYFDGGNWSASSWDVTLQQTIKLPKGKYQLTVKSRASADLTTFRVFAGEESVDMQHIGATGGLFNRGWNDASVEFEVTEAGDVVIGVQGATSTIHQWMSISDFRLYRFDEYVPVYTVAGAFNTEEGGLADPIFGVTWDVTREQNDLVANGDGTYSITFMEVRIDEPGTIWYKVVEDHSWNYNVVGFGESNADYFIENAGTYDITFTFDGGVSCEVKDSEVATAINSIAAAVKAGQVYDLQGKKVTGTLKKGVYVVNGKKTVVK
jgi:hypothetical protein